jgi:O-antigen ligase
LENIKFIGESFNPSRQARVIFGAFAVLSLVGIFAGVVFDFYYLFALPAVFLLVYLTVVNFRAVFFILMATLPMSVEYEFPNGFGTDLPSEPLTVGLMVVYILYLCRTAKQQVFHLYWWRHPITVVLLMHLGWIFMSVLFSQSPGLSVKFLLAKIWYLASFYFLAGVVFKDRRSILLFVKCVFWPLLVAVLVTLVRHSLLGFSFKDVNYALSPYFRNHVNYACMLALFFPFVLLLFRQSRQGSVVKIVVGLGILVFVVGIILSYTRTAQLAVLASVGYYFVVHFRLTRLVLMVASVGVVGFIAYGLVNKNNYIGYAPKFKKTITQSNYSNLIDATSKLEDISTMERAYRWVAGFNMVWAKPWTGFGPNNFYDHYQSYTVTGFKTYVSKNPEHSGIHCYYLMTGVEQGLPGLFFFLLVCFYALIWGEGVYHAAKDKLDRQVVLACLLSFVTILLIVAINDLIETDKIGAFFFLNLAVLVNMDRRVGGRELGI